MLQPLGVPPMLAVVVLPSLLLFDGVSAGGAAGWPTAAGVAVLGRTATLPFGIVLGSLLPGPQKVGTGGMLPVIVLIVLTVIPGTLVPVRAPWAWPHAVARAFPMYWPGLGMRSAFLPTARPRRDRRLVRPLAWCSGCEHLGGRAQLHRAAARGAEPHPAGAAEAHGCTTRPSATASAAGAAPARTSCCASPGFRGAGEGGDSAGARPAHRDADRTACGAFRRMAACRPDRTTP